MSYDPLVIAFCVFWYLAGMAVFFYDWFSGRRFLTTLLTEFETPGVVVLIIIWPLSVLFIPLVYAYVVEDFKAYCKRMDQIRQTQGKR